MRIERNTKFCDLEMGDAFGRNGLIYLKMTPLAMFGGGTVNAVSLASGLPVLMEACTTVDPFSAKVVL